MTDWRALLKDYMALVGAEEGTFFLNSGLATAFFTPDQLALLRAIELELDQEDAND